MPEPIRQVIFALCNQGNSQIFPSPNKHKKLGKSSGVEIIKISFIPESSKTDKYNNHWFIMNW